MTIRIIAEIGVNHNGDMEVAKEMVTAAKACGADIVKFQTFAADRLASVETPKVPYQLRTSDPAESHHAMLKKLELPRAAHPGLKAFCDRLEIEFCSTPYSCEDAEFLDALGVARFKVASADIVDRTLHEFLARTGKECLLAVGMADLEEIADTLEVYTRHHAMEKVVLLHCVSAYPAAPAEVNLRVMETLRTRFGCRVGFSDHTSGVECAIAAVALGACVIEKHFTLDRHRPGPDHAASSAPEEFTALVGAVRTVESALGDGNKRLAESEQAMRAVSRKRIVAARDIDPGRAMQREDFAFRRPGSGISPMRYPELCGRSLRRPLRAGAPITWQDVCEREPVFPATGGR